VPRDTTPTTHHTSTPHLASLYTPKNAGLSAAFLVQKEEEEEEEEDSLF
jgi:hypothetical protein